MAPPAVRQAITAVGRTMAAAIIVTSLFKKQSGLVPNFFSPRSALKNDFGKIRAFFHDVALHDTYAQD
jgi:hypothetical protein